MSHKLMVKTHGVTGLKYLCYTRKSGVKYDEYVGSGVLWKRHIKTHGKNVTTELIFESNDLAEFKRIAIARSIEYDVVNSESWANLKLEEGDGGNTVGSKMWITDGHVDKYHDKSLDIPTGWSKGRSNCVFNDKSRQLEYGARASPAKKSESMKARWASGGFNSRDHSKCGVKGEDNPAKRPEVRKKISETALTQSAQRSEAAKKSEFWKYSPR
jgi:hypothetical protein